MSNFKSFVERAVHIQLQHLTRFQAPTPLVAALVVLSSFPIIRLTSSTFISSLAATLEKALTKLTMTETVPLLTTLFNIFTRTLNTACLRVKIHVKILIQWQHAFNRGHGRSQNDDTYATPRAQARYWRVAGRWRRRLYSGNGTTSSSSPVPCIASRDDVNTVVPLVTYYTPRLLPLYRDHSSGGKHRSREAEVDYAQESRISPRTFCKWHRMVFQDSCHPTLAQAAVQMKYYSNRDLREIQHIARLLPDEQVFGLKGKGTRKAKGWTKYSEMWQEWLENKGMDLVIVFE